MSSLARGRSNRARRARAEHGFTLVELMVAMVGAMFVGIAVFTLAKHSASFYSRESRLADATLQSLVGFERLRSDIARAGFLGTPNIIKDPRLCGDPRDASWPEWLARLSSVTIEPVPPEQIDTPQFAEISPRRVILTGSFVSADQFEVRTIFDSNPIKIVLEPTSLGMANIGYPGAQTAATLSRVFQTGRALRIVDDVGRIQFGVIANVTGGAEPTIVLASAPALQFRASSALNCGVGNLAAGYTVNVVNIIRYDVQDISGDSRFTALFKAGGPSYEATRRDLVREELDVHGDPIDGTRELVAEYAVDLDFSLLVERDRSSSLERVTGAATDAFAGDPASAALAVTGPQMIRGVQTWLSVRSQEADRLVALNVDTAGANTTRLRVNVMTGSDDVVSEVEVDKWLVSAPAYARVRTLQSTISLNNQVNLTWY
ncbi:MAG: prepilin-type N-terminal cleavage/methylation domain-containing protein [Polyangiaceae bacterium]